MSNPTEGASNHEEVVIDLTGSDDEASVASLITLSSDDSSIASVYTVNDISSTEIELIGTSETRKKLQNFSLSLGIR
jgi:hypothetical protein